MAAGIVVSFSVQSPPPSPPARAPAPAPPDTSPRGAGGSYFSVQPPVTPVRLVLVGPPPSGGRVRIRSPLRVQRLMASMQEIEENYSCEPAGYLDEPADFRPISAPVPAAASPSPPGSCSSRPVERLVRVLLVDLLADLPMPGESRRSSSSRRAAGRARAGAECRLDARSCCSIAVQARARPTASAGAGRTDEWVGGVRALRDSHVRLVLRQLRHIHRLNRALDRVAGAPAAAAR